ncbi:MAG: DUF4340 domain-containing protein, partial [Terriglobia bacterium]
NKHKSREEAKKTAPASSQKILKLDANHVRSVTIASNDGKSFTLDRTGKDGKTWAIVKPLPIPADQSKVSSFLDGLTGATVDQVIDPHPADLKDFGLAPPSETITVSTNSTPRQFTLLLGDDTPTGTGLYAQVSGDPRVFTLSMDTKTTLEKKLFDLRDTRAVTLDTDQINSLQVHSGKQSYDLVKNPEGVWEVSLPPDVRADHFSVDGLVDSLQSMTMQSVVSEEKKDPAKYGFQHPSAVIRIISPGGTQQLTVGNKTNGGYYAMNSTLAPVFTLDQDSVTQFQKNASDFRDKNLFSWDMFDVKSFDVTTPKGHWAFEQNKNQWKETAPAAKSASSDDVNAFLSALRNLQASSFPAAKPDETAKFGFNQPAYTFKVAFGNNNQTETVEVGQAKDTFYARRASDALPSEVSSSTLSSIETAFAKISK